MTNIYAYARVSTTKQELERQLKNIKAFNPNAIIISEKWTGGTNNRPKWNQLKESVKSGDTIIFDEISRLSRNAKEGIEDYLYLFNKGVALVFIKQRYLDTETYKQAIGKELAATNNALTDIFIEAINKAFKLIATQQIEAAFMQAEQERLLDSKRTKDGLAVAKANGKQIGRITGNKYITKKEKESIEKIKKYSKAFNGTMKDEELLKLLQISHCTLATYKRKIKESI